MNYLNTRYQDLKFDISIELYKTYE